MRLNIRGLAWGLFAFLIVSIAIIFSSRAERAAFPSITNTRASGYAALAELLERDGYSVRLERSPWPQFDDGDLVIESVLATSDVEFGSSDRADDDRYAAAVREHVEKGGWSLRVYHRRNFETLSEIAEQPKRAIAGFDSDRSYEINVPYITGMPYDPEAQGGYRAWSVDGTPFVEYAPIEAGTRATVADGLFATNRFLDESENAAFALQLVRTLAQPEGRIVFVEAGIGNYQAATVANTLGRWAVAARLQLILLGIVLVITLGIRFGEPETDRRAVRGSRELFDAIADVLRRSKNTSLALTSLLRECDGRLKRVLRLAPNTPRHEVLEGVSPELREAYLNVSELSVSKPKPGEATAAAKKLLRLLNALERDSRSAKGLKR